MNRNTSIATNIIWTLLMQYSTQIIGLFVGILLTYFLTPHEFGVIGMLSIVLSIGNALVTGGMTQSLLRNNTQNKNEYSVVFTFNIMSSIIIYFFIYLISPFVQQFYNQPNLATYLRLLSLIVIINAFSAVQNTLLNVRMQFKEQFLISLPSTIISSIVGVLLAYMKWGIWSLIVMNLMQSFLNTIQLWFYTKWKPSILFDKKTFTMHFNYGYKMTLSSVFNTIFDNIYTIFIGKYYSAAQLGMYTRAYQLQYFATNNLSSAIGKVTFPIVAQLKHNNEALLINYKRNLTLIIYIIAPFTVFLIVSASSIFKLLFNSNWYDAIPYFQILCLSGLFYPIHAYNLNVLKIKGESSVFLYLEIMKKIILTVIVVFCIKYGIIVLLWGQVLFSTICLPLNIYYSGHKIGYTIYSQLKDLILPIVISFLIGLLIFAIPVPNLNTRLHFILHIMFCLVILSVVYIYVTKSIKMKSYLYLSQYLSQFIKRVNTQND